MKATTSNVHAVLVALLASRTSGQTVSFADMRAEIANAGLVVKNWMLVRDVMQHLINTKAISRTADLKVENYILL